MCDVTFLCMCDAFAVQVAARSMLKGFKLDTDTPQTQGASRLLWFIPGLASGSGLWASQQLCLSFNKSHVSMYASCALGWLRFGLNIGSASYVNTSIA